MCQTDAPYWITDRLKSIFYRLLTHMSDRNDPLTAYVEQMDRVLDLSLSPEQQAGVVDNLEKIEAIAKFVNDFPLPETVQAYFTFQP
uniref:DUF4089 domain-containing protein n=1 Tax=Desertifilum tharense IPPAS B-1220 TaxID=1781255 RepID=A0ACD5GTU9_9CYAN